MTYKCKMCGGALKIVPDERITSCEFCGCKQTIPVFDDEKKAALYKRADKLRLQCEFDKAAGIYETIVAESPNEANAYWGLVLCKYGIEYIDDTLTKKKIITCHRTQFSSIYDDSNYLQAIQYADVVLRGIFEEEAAKITALQERIIELSSKEEPYDIFICYKETDKHGERTPDSVLAYEIYKELCRKYKVFFSKITLEKCLGQEYEPHIFAALQTAQVMIHVTCSKENSESLWVKNEWSRYLSLIEQGQKKVIITCYKGIQPNNLPKPLQKIQGLDMSKIGAMQDLVRGIESIISLDSERTRVESMQQIIDDQKRFEERYADAVNELIELDSYCVSASDVATLIAIFEEVGDYKDAKLHLYEAKMQYIKRVSTFYECVQALKYIEEIDDRNLVEKLKNEVSNKAINYRRVELQKIHYIPSFDGIYDTTGLCDALIQYITMEEKDRSSLLDIDLEIIDDYKNKTIPYLNEISSKIIQLENKTSNLQEIATTFEKVIDAGLIEIKADEFYSQATKKIEAINDYIQKQKKKKTAIKVAIVVAIVLVIIISIAATASKYSKKDKGYSADHFVVQVLSKENESYNTELATGYVGSGYNFNFRFRVTNNSQYGITYITGNMDILDQTGDVLATTTVYLSGNLSSKASGNWDVDVNIPKGDDAVTIWNSKLNELTITFKITSITFEDGTQKRYSDTRNVIVN